MSYNSFGDCGGNVGIAVVYGELLSEDRVDLLLPPGATEAPCRPGGRAEVVGLLHSGRLEPCEHELCDPVTSGQVDHFTPQILHDDAELTPVIGVDGTGTVGDGQAMLEREPGAGTDLAFDPLWQLHHKSGRNQ